LIVKRFRPNWSCRCDANRALAMNHFEAWILKVPSWLSVVMKASWP
jgi:hypothetical protein